MTEPMETRTPEQMALAAAVSPDALTVVQEPGGPVQAIAIKQLLGRLISTNTAKTTEAILQDDLTHPNDAIGLVYADPSPAKCGWYRMSNAPAGPWVQFEKLSAQAVAEAVAAAEVLTDRLIITEDGKLTVTGALGAGSLNFDIALSKLIIRILKADRLYPKFIELPGGATLLESLRLALDVGGEGTGSALQVGHGGEVRAGAAQIGSLKTHTSYAQRQFRGQFDRNIPNLPAQVCFLPWWTQSWGLGIDGQGALNTVSRYTMIVAFNGGLIQQYSVAEDAAALQSLEVAVETNRTGTREFPAASVGSTGLVACAEQIIDMLIGEDNFTPTANDLTLHGSAMGEGSKSIEQLRASPYWDRLLEQTTRSFLLAKAANKTWAAPALFHWESQSALAAAAYAAACEEARTAYTTHCRTLRADHPEVVFLTWQPLVQNSSDAALDGAKGRGERIAAMDAYPNLYVVNASHQLQNSTDPHFTPQSNREMSQAYGYAWKRVICDQRTDWRALQKVSLKPYGPIAELELSLERGSLEVDTRVPKTNYGFDWRDGSNVAIAINIPVVTNNKIIFSTASGADFPADAKLGYARTGTALLPSADKWTGQIRSNGSRYVGGIDHYLMAGVWTFD